MKTDRPRRHSGLCLPLLALTFGAASGFLGGRAKAQEAPPLPPASMTAPGHTFWKHPDYDAVIEVWTEPVRGLRGKIASLNPNDEKIRKVVGKILKKEEDQVSAKDVLSFVGMEGDLNLHRDGANKWTGSMYWPYKDKSYGVDVEQDAAKLHVRGFLLLLPFIGKSADLKPAAAPAPKTP
jgi:uncharacterized protein (DUF2147 family)